MEKNKKIIVILSLCIVFGIVLIVWLLTPRISLEGNKHVENIPVGERG